MWDCSGDGGELSCCLETGSGNWYHCYWNGGRGRRLRFLIRILEGREVHRAQGREKEARLKWEGCHEAATRDKSRLGIEVEARDIGGMTECLDAGVEGQKGDCAVGRGRESYCLSGSSRGRQGPGLGRSNSCPCRSDSLKYGAGPCQWRPPMRVVENASWLVTASWRLLGIGKSI